MQPLYYGGLYRVTSDMKPTDMGILLTLLRCACNDTPSIAGTWHSMNHANKGLFACNVEWTMVRACCGGLVPSGHMVL